MSDASGSSRRPHDPSVWDDDEWTEEDERRYQERRARERGALHRRRRHALIFALLAMLVLGVGTGAAGVVQGWWSWPFSPQPTATQTVVVCPTPDVTAAPVAEVTLIVLNSTDRPGLAGSVAEQLQVRGFTVGSIGNDPLPDPIPQAAVVRHGPEGLEAARTVAAHVVGAELVDDGRAGTAVELSLGTAFETLRPPEEAAVLIAPAPVPSPEGCVLPPDATTTAPSPPPSGPTGTTPPPTSPAPSG